MNEQLDASTSSESDVVMPGQVSQSAEPEVNSESSTDSGVNHEEKHNGVQERFNKLTADKYTEKRRADDLQRQIDDMKSAAPTAPVVPAESFDAPKLPDDIYDEDSMRKYYSDSAKYNQQAATKAAQSTYEQQQKNTTEQAAQAKRQEVVNKYTSNAVRDGVDMDKLRLAENTVNQSGINPQLIDYIMNDINGAKIVETLHDNPALMHEILSLDPISAGMRIASEVKPLALSKTKNISNAPTPPTEIKGGGVHEQDEFDKNYPGATFI